MMLQCSTVQYSAVQYSTVQYIKVQYSTVEYHESGLVLLEVLARREVGLPGQEVPGGVPGPRHLPLVRQRGRHQVGGRDAPAGGLGSHQGHAPGGGGGERRRRKRIMSRKQRGIERSQKKIEGAGEIEGEREFLAR